MNNERKEYEQQLANPQTPEERFIALLIKASDEFLREKELEENGGEG